MIVDQKKLDLYVSKNFNVLFEGERGVGKTSVIYKTFEKAGLRVKYFSAPTMDPWTDLVGVPKNVLREDGKEVLRMIPPEDFVDDNYDVLFIDELNRAPSKVLNAVMELIQFRSINGRKYNIKMIWAAINPHSDNDDYQVEKLDKALEDRFQIKIKFPYQVDKQFFQEQHGQIGSIFCEWWENQSPEIQKEISPRRLFETTSFYKDGGDIADMITVGNISKLKADLKNSSILITLENDFKNQTISKKTKNILSLNYSEIITKFLMSKPKIFEFFFPHLNKEWLSTQFINKTYVYNYILNLSQKTSEDGNLAKNIIQNIIQVASSSFLKQNQKDLTPFISQEKEKELENIPINDLITTSSQEANFVKLIASNNFMNQEDKSMSDFTSYYNLSRITDILKSSKNYESNDFPIEKIMLQIGERLGFLLAYYYVKNDSKLGVSSQKTYDSFLNSSSINYIWNKKNILNINPKFSDIAPLISNKFESLKHLTKQEIKDLYILQTSNNKKRKMKV